MRNEHLYDPRSMWARRRQIAPDGAILIRPDRFVAWRCKAASEAPLEQLSNALSQILARPIAVQPAAA
jgi:2,4-dichlorophenol 6-monooxygenase